MQKIKILTSKNREKSVIPVGLFDIISTKSSISATISMFEGNFQG